MNFMNCCRLVLGLVATVGRFYSLPKGDRYIYSMYFSTGVIDLLKRYILQDRAGLIGLCVGSLVLVAYREV